MREIIQLSGNDSIETVYIFGEKHVTRVKKTNSQRTLESGELRTNNISLSYIIKDLNERKCMILGETSGAYPPKLFIKENEAIKTAIFHIADKEKLMVMQSENKPDYGYVPIKMHAQTRPSGKLTRPSTTRRFNIL